MFIFARRCGYVVRFRGSSKHGVAGVRRSRVLCRLLTDNVLCEFVPLKVYTGFSFIETHNLAHAM